MSRSQHHCIVSLAGVIHGRGRPMILPIDVSTEHQPRSGLFVIVSLFETSDASPVSNMIQQMELSRVHAKVGEQLRVVHVIGIVHRRWIVTEGHEFLGRIDHSGFHHARFPVHGIGVVIPEATDIIGHLVAGGHETAVETRLDTYQATDATTNDCDSSHSRMCIELSFCNRHVLADKNSIYYQIEKVSPSRKSCSAI